eukprot:Sspe_Gene.39028::Locus_18834_Transcript_2_3_Confidence_0.500_Length_3506::g.39028::m.39028
MDDAEWHHQAVTSGEEGRMRSAMQVFCDSFTVNLLAGLSDADPVSAIDRIISGTAPPPGAIASPQLRSLLFSTFNTYDVSGSRSLRAGADAVRFFSDFADAFADALARIGPEVAAKAITSPNESWEERSRSDAAGQIIVQLAARFRAGFQSNPGVWARRCFEFIDSTFDGRGLRYAEVQAALAGTRVQSFLQLLSSATLTAEEYARLGTPVSCPLPLSFAGSVPRGRRGSFSTDSVCSPLAGDVALPPPPPLTLDVADAACALHGEEKKRLGTMCCIYYVVYFALLITVLLMQMGVSETHHLHVLLHDHLVVAEFAPSRSLPSVRSFDDIWGWLHEVWAPFLFRDIPNLRAGMYNVVVATPFLRQQRRRVDTGCKEPVNIAVYNAFANDSCFDMDSFSSTAFTGAASNLTFSPVHFRRPYHTPGPDGDDFMVAFPLSEGSFASPGDPNSRVVRTVAEAQAALRALQEDRWLSYQTAYLEVYAMLYNPNLDVLGHTKVVFAVTPGGGVLPLATASDPYGGSHGGSSIMVRRAHLYGKDADTARLVLEVAVVVLTAVELLVEGVRAVRETRKAASWLGYLSSTPWSTFQLIYFSIFFSTVGLYASSIPRLPSVADGGVLLDGASHDGGDPIYPTAVTLGGICMILAVLRVVRYLGCVSTSFSMVHRAVELAIWPLVPFLVLLMLAVVTYAIVGYYFFGHGIRSFSTMAASVQTVIQYVIHGELYDLLDHPMADESYGVFPPIFFWSFVLVMVLLLGNLFLAILVSTYDCVLDTMVREQREHLDVPSTGRLWSRRSISYHWSNHPSTILRRWVRGGWVLPVARRHPIKSLASAEVVGGTNLRITLTICRLQAVEGCSSICFVLPRDMLRCFDNPLDPSATTSEGCAMLTRCQGGYEPKRCPRANWCVFVREWWMEPQYLADWRQSGSLWMAADEGGTFAAGKLEVRRRVMWYEAHERGMDYTMEGSATTVSTIFIPFRVGVHHPRSLHIESKVTELLVARADWMYQTLVFEFPDVVSPASPHPHHRTLPVQGLYRTTSSLFSPPTSDRAVLAVGDQHVPAYVPCGARERFTDTEVLREFAKYPNCRSYVEDMVVGRFGVSESAPPGTTLTKTAPPTRSASDYPLRTPHSLHLP